MSQMQEVQKEREQAPGTLGITVEKNLVGVHIPKKMRMGHKGASCADLPDVFAFGCYIQ